MSSEFFAMGGYGFYVWLSYGVSALVLIVNIIVARRGERERLSEILQRASADKTGP